MVEAQRSLFVGDLADPTVLLGFGVALTFGALGALLGMRAMNRIAE